MSAGKADHFCFFIFVSIIIITIFPSTCLLAYYDIILMVHRTEIHTTSKIIN